MSAAVAAVVDALILTRILKPGGQEVCKFGTERLARPVMRRRLDGETASRVSNGSSAGKEDNL